MWSANETAHTVTGATKLTNTRGKLQTFTATFQVYWVEGFIEKYFG